MALAVRSAKNSLGDTFFLWTETPLSELRESDGISWYHLSICSRFLLYATTISKRRRDAGALTYSAEDFGKRMSEPSNPNTGGKRGYFFPA